MRRVWATDGCHAPISLPWSGLTPAITQLTGASVSPNMRLKDRFASKRLAFRLSSDRIGSRQGALGALPNLHGRKRGDEAFLCAVRIAGAVALSGLRVRE